jgi:hypothetical protein
MNETTKARHMVRVRHYHPRQGSDGTPKFWLWLACGHFAVIKRAGRKQSIVRAYCRYCA